MTTKEETVRQLKYVAHCLRLSNFEKGELVLHAETLEDIAKEIEDDD